MPDFAHLHCHTQYSLLDGASSIKKMMEKAKDDGQEAVTITDHGNMFGVFDFYNQAQKNNLKPIIGCEFYVVEDRHQKKFDRTHKDKRYHQLMLAKNSTGYQNLAKLCSLGYTEGYYQKWPRIDKVLIRQYSEGLIATTCCLAAEIPQVFLQYGEAAAEQKFLEWWEIFGDDYYIELQRHGLKTIDEASVNDFLIRLSQKYGVKRIATNDSHYINREDWNAHDTLLCINTGEFKDNPMGDKEQEIYRFVTSDGQIINTTTEDIKARHGNDKRVQNMLQRMQGKGSKFKPRFGFENDQFYFKTKQEMADLFSDVPDAIENTLEIVEKIQTPELKRDILLPNYTLPEGFEDMDQYLRYLTYETAKQRYGELTQDVVERLEHELGIITNMGFSGYFLIVQDFINAARKEGVWVGPGRGSAAGSAVAYAIGITNVDPLEYDLLFERFLNPERVNMPDIDIDFDDHGRQKVIDYVVEQYGKNQVAHIITYGKMAARSAVRDTARVMEYPLEDTDKLAKRIPEGPAVSLEKAFEDNQELKEIRDQQETEESELLNNAATIEGAIRNRGLHAAGVIIAPDDIRKYIPVCVSPKETDLLVTQFDGNYIEDAGMLKMDFLGLKTLTIAKEAVSNIEKTHGYSINLDQIPFDDETTFRLFQRGDTVAIFQFESEGMQTYLKQLAPTSLKDLIAMNALYRPGPMDNIPSFVRRKHGQETVAYPHRWLKEILDPTYGIMVYQEQIMQVAQTIGGFSLGKADILRKAMGKKQMDKMQSMKQEFIDGAKEKGVDGKKADEIFQIMEKFAAYGFNRAHATAYSMIAYQTGYLKANYPAEFMAAVLSQNMEEIDKVVNFIEECRRMGIQVLPPDVNESDYQFNVNTNGDIRFGMGAIKGVGEAAVRAIVEERQKRGAYQDIFDLVKRVNLRAVNRKALESLASAGALDTFEGYHRAQYFAKEKENGPTLLEKALKFGQRAKEVEASAKQSLFGGTEELQVSPPKVPECEPWSLVDKLNQERELIGFYVSGHPLDDYRVEYTRFCERFDQEYLSQRVGHDISIGGIITSVVEKQDKRGRRFAFVTLEGYQESLVIPLFADTYLQYQNLMTEGTAVNIKGTVETKYKRDDAFTVKLRKAQYLADLRDQISAITVDIHLDHVGDQLIGELENLVSAHQGECQLRLNVRDPENRIQLSMPSVNFKVAPDDDLINELQRMQEIQDLNLQLAS
jgi:DNA polymerase-3 subunit alpha